MHSCWLLRFLPRTRRVTAAPAGSIAHTRSILSELPMPPIEIIPFGPIPLDLEGFHESPFNRTLGKSSSASCGR